MYRETEQKPVRPTVVRALKTGCRRLGSPLAAGTAALAVPAAPWLCAWADCTPGVVIAAAALAQAAWLFIWTQRCNALWYTQAHG